MMAIDEEQSVNDSKTDVNRKADKALLNYIKNTLRATRPWTRLLAILGFIMAAITLLSGTAMIIGRNVIPAVAGKPPPVLTGVVTAATSIVYLVPSIWLLKYSSAITRFLDGGGAVELANALVYQKSFWKFIGIITLVSIMLAVFGILAAVVVPTLLFFRG
jgi:hypothetical protein